MNKVVYGIGNLFSLKKYNHVDTLCKSYEYPTYYAIRSAILGAIIKVDGIEIAKKLFFKVKNSNIYVQYPKKFSSNMVKQSRLKRNRKQEARHTSTIGLREYFYMDKIVIYIDNMIPDVEIYLKNIDWLGNAEGMVYLESFEKVDKMESVLIKTLNLEEENLYEQHDWDKKTEFENVYAFSGKYKHINSSFYCKISDLTI